MNKTVAVPEQEIAAVEVAVLPSATEVETIAAPEPVAAKPAAKKAASKKAAVGKVVAKKTVAAKPAAEVASEAAKPVAKPVTKPVTKHKAKPEAKPKAEPVAKTAAQAKNDEAPAKPAKVIKAKKVVVKKPKLVRDSFTFPENDYALLAVLKQRALSAGHEIKKSELLRAGLSTLAAMPEASLIEALNGVERIKTGRPSK